MSLRDLVFDINFKGNTDALVKANEQTNMFKQNVQASSDSLKGLQDTSKKSSVGIRGAFEDIKRGTSNALGGVSNLFGGLMSIKNLLIGGTIAVGIKKSLDVFDEFQGMDRILRVGTGAEGRALGDLRDITMDLATDLPTSFGAAANVVQDLNTRLGLTGDSLEGLSSKVINLGRITGEDPGGLTRPLSRLMGDWGIQAERGEETIERLFKMSQASGAGVTQLADSMVQYGAPLRSLGYEFDEVLAMLGKWEKEGVNTETILSRLRIASNKLTKEGFTDSRKGLEDLMETMKTSDYQTALMVGTWLVGEMAATDFTVAVRENRFEFEEYEKATEGVVDANGDVVDSIGKIADETKTTKEVWIESWNTMKTAGLPIITELGNAVLWLANNAITPLLRVISDLGQGAPSAFETLRTNFNVELEKIKADISWWTDGDLFGFDPTGKMEIKVDPNQMNQNARRQVMGDAPDLNTVEYWRRGDNPTPSTSLTSSTNTSSMNNNINVTIQGGNNARETSILLKETLEEELNNLSIREQFRVLGGVGAR